MVTTPLRLRIPSRRRPPRAELPVERLEREAAEAGHDRRVSALRPDVDRGRVVVDLDRRNARPRDDDRSLLLERHPDVVEREPVYDTGAHGPRRAAHGEDPAEA